MHIIHRPQDSYILEGYANLNLCFYYLSLAAYCVYNDANFNY